MKNFNPLHSGFGNPLFSPIPTNYIGGKTFTEGYYRSILRSRMFSDSKYLSGSLSDDDNNDKWKGKGKAINTYSDKSESVSDSEDENMNKAIAESKKPVKIGESSSSGLAYQDLNNEKFEQSNKQLFEKLNKEESSSNLTISPAPSFASEPDVATEETDAYQHGLWEQEKKLKWSSWEDNCLDDPKLSQAMESCKKEEDKLEELINRTYQPFMSKSEKNTLKGRIDILEDYTNVFKAKKEQLMDYYRMEQQYTDEGLGKDRTPTPQPDVNNNSEILSNNNENNNLSEINDNENKDSDNSEVNNDNLKKRKNDDNLENTSKKQKDDDNNDGDNNSSSAGVGPSSSEPSADTNNNPDSNLNSKIILLFSIIGYLFDQLMEILNNSAFF